jgi:hypothetical protein
MTFDGFRPRWQDTSREKRRVQSSHRWLRPDLRQMTERGDAKTVVTRRKGAYGMQKGTA